GVLTIDELQKLLRRGTTVGLDASLQPGAAGEIDMEADNAFALRKGKIDKSASNLLQGLDIDESLGLDQVDEQIRDYLSKKAVRVVELFRQWDDDDTGQIEKKEFRRGMKELGLTVSKAQLDELFSAWDKDKTGFITIEELQKLLRRGSTIELDAALQPGAAGEIEVTRDQNIALRTAKVDKSASNLLQGLDIDESLGLDQVDEQARRVRRAKRPRARVPRGPHVRARRLVVCASAFRIGGSADPRLPVGQGGARDRALSPVGRRRDGPDREAGVLPRHEGAGADGEQGAARRAVRFVGS
ncbi:MAG: EF-hand domain-containing protein, partial [Planctomycetota bacterium]|nr:EF-hand domain-containing protein [Planctomycetota bacterium]